jgi:Ca-activated chloride channel homolog
MLLAGIWPTAVATLLVAWLLWVTTHRIDRVAAFEFEHARYLWLLLLWPSVVHVAWRSLSGVSRWQRIAMATTRCLLLFALTVVLAEPRVRVRTEARCTVSLVDVSQSMSDQAIEQAQRSVERYAGQRRAGDESWRVAFDAEPRVITGSLVAARSPGDSAHASDYGRALRFSAGLCRADQNRQLLLFGDGLDTAGELAQAGARLHQLGYSVSVIPSRVPPPADLAVGRVTLPARVELGRPFRVGVDLHATRATEAALRFELDAVANPRDPGRELALPAGDMHVEFESVVGHAGKARFRATATVQGPDAIAENNQASASIEVRGPPKVLYVEARRERATALESALSAQRFDVEVISPAAFPTSLDALSDYAFVVLSDLRRDQLGAYADALLERYVRELGGGLLFAGGSSSYAAGGWSGSPLERILPVTMASTEQQQTADVAVVLVIDRSGSMSGLPLEMAKAACGATVETLRTTDLVEVIAFDAKPVRYVAMQKARARVAIANDLSRMLSGGDTELFPALDMAYQDLLAVEARRKHVILLTDGQSPKAGLEEIVQNMLAESITLTIVGLGPDVDTELLRHLAGRGGGRYHAAPDPNSLPRIFTHEAEALVVAPESSSWFEVRVKRPSEFLRGIPIEQAPPLHGYARTRKKPPPAEVILQSDRGEPILSRLRYGAGWTLAWTSDLRGEWAADWVRWPEYGRFFAQLLRQHQGRRLDKTIPMQVELDGDRLKLTVDAVTAAGTFDNDRTILLAIDGPDPASSSTLGLEPVAPGLYQAATRLPKLGDYHLHATHRHFDAQGRAEPLGDSYAEVSLSYPIEYERITPDLAALEQLAELGGGGFDPSPQAVRDSPRREFVSYRPWHVPWLLAALVILLVDLFCKRIRLRPRALRH